MKSNYHQFPPECRQFVKAECLAAIGDPSPLIRTTIAQKEFGTWPELLPMLLQMLDHEDYNVCEVHPLVKSILNGKYLLETHYSSHVALISLFRFVCILFHEYVLC